MRPLAWAALAATLTLAAACVKKNDVKPAEPAMKKTEPVKVAEPAKVKAAPAPKPEPAPEATAPKKRRRVPLGLIPLPVLKEEIGLDNKQLKQCRAIYAEYRERVEAAAAKLKEASDKKAARREINPLRKEILEKIRATFTPEQTAKFEAFVAKRREAAKTRQQQKK